MLPVLLALSTLTGCAGTCGQHSFVGWQVDEPCGPAGSFGFVYFEDTMVRLLLGGSDSDFGTPEMAAELEYLPSFTIGFRTEHLTDGLVMGNDEVVALCSRTLGYEVGDPTLYSWHAESVEFEVLGPSDWTQTSGQSWEIRWDVRCPADADMGTSGTDVLELYVEEVGWDFDLWGVPGDWPQEWE